MLKKKIISFITSIACIASLNVFSGAGAAESVRNFNYKGTLPTGGDKLTILCWSSSEIPQMLDMWLNDTGYTEDQVNFVNFGVGGGEALDCYEKYLASGKDVDIIIAKPDWALELLNDDTKTVPMSKLGFTDSDFSDQYKYTVELGKDSDGVFKGVSYDVCPGTWCYRTDLAEKYLGITSPEEMQEAVKGLDFLDVCDKLRDASNCNTAFTTTINGLFNSLTCNKNKPWVIDNKLNPEMSDDSISHYGRLFKMMKENNVITDIGTWSSDWFDIGQTDKTMGYFISSWGFNTILLPASGGVNGKTYGKWGVCQGPMPYYWGGTMMCVSSKTDNADMAADFIDYFTVNKETMKKYALTTNFENLPNSMSVMQELIDEGAGKSGVIADLLGGQDRLEVMDDSARRIGLTYDNITPYDSKIEIDLLTAINYYCDGTTNSEEEFVEDFKNRISKYISGSDDFLRGDINNNGELDLYDAIGIAEYLVKKRNFTVKQLDIADYNHDEKVDLYDVIGIAKALIKH